MAIDETLRVYPTANLILREASNPVEIGGFALPKGTPLATTIWPLHHNPKYWKDPEVFNPERFSEENAKNIIPYTYFPFGMGPHVCIGQKFALVECKVIAATILQKYTLQFVEGQKVEPVYSVLVRPAADFKMRLIKRVK